MLDEAQPWHVLEYRDTGITCVLSGTYEACAKETRRRKDADKGDPALGGWACVPTDDALKELARPDA